MRHRAAMPSRPRLWPLLALAAACRGAPAGHTGSGPTLDLTTATTAPADGSTTGTDVSDVSDASDTTAASTGEPARDLPLPDFADDTPPGCRGKIDFLFVVGRDTDSKDQQEQRIAAFPQFIAIIESKFADFDHHIMVIDGDTQWGSAFCEDYWCPERTCLYGEDCCPTAPPDKHGLPCCSTPDYPCEGLDTLTQCDYTWGAGVLFSAGKYASNKPCPVEGGRRYLVKGQTDLAGTFTCLASVGTDAAGGALGQAFTAAMQPAINAPGGCNKGFLRDDALLMVTFLGGTFDTASWPLDSEGYPFQWAEAALDAKHGDAGSIVMLYAISLNEDFGPPCSPFDRICQLVEMFPYHHTDISFTPDYAAAFLAAADLVDTACAGFVPPA
jgi:hypothetical protein